MFLTSGRNLFLPSSQQGSSQQYAWTSMLTSTLGKRESLTLSLETRNSWHWLAMWHWAGRCILRYSENVAGLIPSSSVGEILLIGKGLKFHPRHFEESSQQFPMSTIAGRQVINQSSPFKHFIGLEGTLLHPLWIQVAPLKSLGRCRRQGGNCLRLQTG